jgi:hypothetical protein
MEKFAYDVLVGLLVAFLTLVAKWQWPLITSLFESEEVSRLARQISGTWDATEDFTGSSTTDTFAMEINCRGGR